jgi:hypothetical protein
MLIRDPPPSTDAFELISCDGYDPDTVTFYAVLPLVAGLFLAMVTCLEMGFRAGQRRMRLDQAAHEGIGSNPRVCHAHR